ITWREKIASVPMSLAIAVRMAGSSARSIARRAGQPCGAARTSATASIASVAEPPLPSASRAPPASRRARSAAAAAAGAARPPPAPRRGERRASLRQRLLEQRADLLGLHEDRCAQIAQHGVEVVLLLG